MPHGACLRRCQSRVLGHDARHVVFGLTIVGDGPSDNRAWSGVVRSHRKPDIMELREHMCRWPLGDPGREDFRFCGSRVGPSGPYCTHHASIAYQPVMDRRRDRDRERRAARG